MSRLEEARTIGAEESAPYDYYSAEVRIAEARRLAARAEYGSAIKLAKEAEGFSGKAIVAAREAKARADAKGTPQPYEETLADPKASTDPASRDGTP